jgi:hypothetical protein
MNTFIARVPNFIDRSLFDEDLFKPIEFTLIEELYKIEALQSWIQNKNFLYFRIWDDYLMACCNNYSYWVVGHLVLESSIDLEHIDLSIFNKENFNKFNLGELEVLKNESPN